LKEVVGLWAMVQVCRRRGQWWDPAVLVLSTMSSWESMGRMMMAVGSCHFALGANELEEGLAALPFASLPPLCPPCPPSSV
jgi:hypothetical protein